MRLAKNHLDVGLFTQDIVRQRAFWGEQVGLRFDFELPFREGWVQHRFDAHGTVVKVNHYADPMPKTARTGYVGVTIARDGDPWETDHVDGYRVRTVPTGTDGIVGVGVTIASPDPSRLMEFYVDAMEFERVGPTTARCGDSLLFVEKGVGGGEIEDFVGPGFRYLTVQIFDADKACDEIVARGGRLARTPISFGTIARYGFVKDPDGNWIEISARASLTGIAPA